MKSRSADVASASGMRLNNLPRKVGTQEYDAAREQLVHHVTGHPDFIGLHEFGSLGALGISDLDFVVVSADAPRGGAADHLRSTNLPSLVQELMNGGTLMVMRRDDLAKIRVWDDLSVTPLWGNPVRLAEPVDHPKESVEICRLVDWIPERASSLLACRLRDDVPVKRALGILYSLRYSLLRLQRVTGTRRPERTAFCEAIVKLRSDWYRQHIDTSLGQFMEVFDHGLWIAFEAIRDLEEHLNETEIYSGADVPDGAQLLMGPQIRFCFSDIPPDQRMNLSLSGSEPEQVMLVLPRLLYTHFAAYAVLGGFIGERLGRSLRPRPDVAVLSGLPLDHRRLLGERIAWVDRMGEFLYRNRFDRGLFKFGWYLPPIR